ncbi:DUF4396 domain-containing protein [Roseovarius salis]|uniref:DUF4396 domain-containing protein n=1 Tax=Roseovarius salis TaxID=3376063 RepID=UPI0037C6D3DB
METVVTMLSSPAALVIWGAVVAACEIVLLRDLRRNNAHLMGLMKVVWALTVLYSGPLGLLIYWTSGRKEIRRDNLPRRAFRSVAHCYSGCGMGEAAGLLIAVGVFQLSTPFVAGITFALAYLSGFALTVGPLMQEGVAPRAAVWDAVLSETPSITVMEVVAITVDLYLAGGAGPGQPLFWSSLAVSLTCGLVAAWPVNLLLIRYGVKEGMMDPRQTHHHAA